MGVWFTSQSDNYAPASSAATHALKSCFPGSKLGDAVVYCHSEILDYIWDCLFKDEDYSDEQKERVLVGGIAGYSLILQEIDIGKILNNESLMLRHSNFWSEKKLYKVVSGKDKSPTVKTAWFSMIYSCQHFLPSIAQGKKKQPIHYVGLLNINFIFLFFIL